MDMSAVAATLTDDPSAAVRREAWPQARDRHELHEALTSVVALTGAEVAPWRDWLAALVAEGRATRFERDEAPPLWVATERLPLLLAVFPAARAEPDVRVPAEFAGTPGDGAASPENDHFA